VTGGLLIGPEEPPDPAGPLREENSQTYNHKEETLTDPNERDPLHPNGVERSTADGRGKARAGRLGRLAATLALGVAAAVVVGGGVDYLATLLSPSGRAVQEEMLRRERAGGAAADAGAPRGYLDWLGSALGRLAGQSRPEFKVLYGDDVEDRQTQCGRNLCPTEQVAVRRLTVQSLSRGPVSVEDVVVNENPECTANPMAKLVDALRAEGRDPGVMAAFAGSSLKRTMSYGDVMVVPLSGCVPLNVRVVTDRGETIYTFGD
jgi:hypothetical protein